MNLPLAHRVRPRIRHGYHQSQFSGFVDEIFLAASFLKDKQTVLFSPQTMSYKHELTRTGERESERRARKENYTQARVINSMQMIQLVS